MRVALPPGMAIADPVKCNFLINYDAWLGFEFFLNLQNYWLQGFSGITGLDHSAVINRIKLFEPSRSKQLWLLECVEAIESGALQAWADKRAMDDDAKPTKEKQDRGIQSLSPEQKKHIQERRARRC